MNLFIRLLIHLFTKSSSISIFYSFILIVRHVLYHSQRLTRLALIKTIKKGLHSQLPTLTSIYSNRYHPPPNPTQTLIHLLKPQSSSSILPSPDLLDVYSPEKETVAVFAFELLDEAQKVAAVRLEQTENQTSVCLDLNNG